MLKSNISWLAAAFVAVTLVSACADDKSEPANPVSPYNPTEKPSEQPSAAGYTIGEISTVFGFTAQNRYSYCPSVLAHSDGSADIYFCGNPTREVMIDNVYHISTAADGSRSTERSVLQPGAQGTWDSQHTCDPSVVKGAFKMDGHTYSYAMFYLGSPIEYYYNEVGVAFADTPDARQWVKYPRAIVNKSWDTEGDLPYAPGAYCWGTGQPSAISLDNAGKMLLTYTLGDLAGTRLMVSEVDFSDMAHPVISGPVQVSQRGLINSLGADSDYICDADIALEPESSTLVMIRPVQPHPDTYPAYINASLDVCTIPFDDFRRGTGTWKQLYRISPEKTGYPRNHNACISRDEYGRLSTLTDITLYFTTASQSPDVVPETGRHAEWTYTIRRATITHTP